MYESVEQNRAHAIEREDRARDAQRSSADIREILDLFTLCEIGKVLLPAKQNQYCLREAAGFSIATFPANGTIPVIRNFRARRSLSRSLTDRCFEQLGEIFSFFEDEYPSSPSNFRPGQVTKLPIKILRNTPAVSSFRGGSFNESAHARGESNRTFPVCNL